MYQKISRCLISVSDKKNLIELAKFLTEKNIEIISTGGTYKALRENNIPAIEISDFTNFPEIMDGRLKTLHPLVHGGLLAIPNNKTHQRQSIENNIKSIDLLVVNLYPFIETVAKTNNEDEIIENIDIGGPAMIRSAAKNFLYKTVLSSPDYYELLKFELEKNNNSTSVEFRKRMAANAFKNIAEYDVAIANYFSLSLDESSQDFERRLKSIQSMGLKQNLRYGENSHQKAAIYSDLTQQGIVNAVQTQGKELSYNNFNDADAAYNLALEFDLPSCIIVKHANPCGAATSSNLIDSYKKALASDQKSAFGGIVALNGEIDEELATEITKMLLL